MREISEINNDISKISDKRKLILEEVEEKKPEVEELKKIHSKTVAAEIGKSRKSQGLTSQRSQIDKVNRDILDLEDANKQLSTQLEELSQEFEHARAFDQFEKFRLEEARFFDRIAKAKKALTEFIHLASGSLPIPLEGIWSLLNKLRLEVSLPELFEKGEIQKADPAKNQEWLDSLVSGYKNLLQDLPPVVDLSFFESQLRYAYGVAEAVSTGARGISSGIKAEIPDKPVEMVPSDYVRQHPERYSEADKERAGLGKKEPGVSPFGGIYE